VNVGLQRVGVWLDFVEKGLQFVAHAEIVLYDDEPSVSFAPARGLHLGDVVSLGVHVTVRLGLGDDDVFCCDGEFETRLLAGRKCFCDLVELVLVDVHREAVNIDALVREKLLGQTTEDSVENRPVLLVVDFWGRIDVDEILVG